MSTNAAETIRKFERMSRQSFVSPAGRADKNKASSPLDRTVAETPSPGSTDSSSKHGVQVKVLVNTESPTKPFDEATPYVKPKVERDFDSIWNSNDDGRDYTHDQISNRRGTVDASRNKSSFDARSLNQIMNGESSPDIAPVQIKGKRRVKKPVPFLSTGLSTSPMHQKMSTAPSLSEEIALAQELGMAETLATAPESAQRALIIQSSNPPSSVDVTKFVVSPLSDVSARPHYATERNQGQSTVEDVNRFRPNFLFKKYERKQSFDAVDEILARESSDIPKEAPIEYNLFKAKVSQEWKAPGSDTDSEVPFDCTSQNEYDTNAEEKKEKTNKFSFGRIFRNGNGSTAGTTLKKEHRSASNPTPNEARGTMKNIYNSSHQPSEINPSDRKSKKEQLEEELFSPLTFDSDKTYDPSDPSKRTIQNGSPEKHGKRSHSDEKEKRFELRTAIYICILIALMIIGVIAALITSGTISLWSTGESNVVEINPSDEIFDYSSEATFTPTEIFEQSNVFEGSETVACANAVPLTEMDRAYYGSNWKAFWDASIDTCGDQMSTGYAVWYSFTTNSSKLVEASTCNNADFDTQITVMSGSCDERTCVSFNDQACGDQSLVTWYAEANTTYYLMVHGYREATGTFGLTLSEAFHNDQCTSAVKLEEESVLAGTTAGATSLAKPPECGDVDLTTDGVWYEVDNISGFYKAELLLGYTEFSGQVAIYRSMDNENLGCKALICEKGSSSGSAIWLADATKTYYVYVSGKNEVAGDFDLYLGRNKDSSCTFGTRVDSNSVGLLASTKSSNPQNVKSCGYTGYHTAPGLWFSVIGTGEMLEASTCGSLLDLDTQVSVFGNSCDSLECIGGTGQDHPCGANGAVVWQTEKDEIYSIYVSGRSSRVGDFVLTIKEAPRQDGFTCDGSLQLEVGSTTIQSNTTSAPSERVDLCTGMSAVRGVWHEFIGTGMTMKISVCNDETDFEARISLFTGSCNGLSCVAYTQSKCGENDEILISTHVGVNYYVFVHGSDSVSLGNYLLTIEEEQINDSCGMASSIELSGSPQYFGSTLSAQNSIVPECDGISTSTSAALWYTFVGTGERIILSTCSVETDYNSDIRVFTGRCSEFECISDVSITPCQDQAMLSFQSTIDDVYYLRIGGSNPSSAGNFLLEVNPRSRFFGP